METMMETMIVTIIALIASVVGVVITSMKERKDIANLKEYVKDDIKEYLQNDIRKYIENDVGKVIDSTNEITKHSIDPNVLKILENAEFVKEDIKTKNLLSEEYKGKINRNLMIANIESVYDKIVELEIEKSKIKEDFFKEKDQIMQEKSSIYNEKEQLKNEIYFLENKIEDLKEQNKDLREQLKAKEPKQDRGFSR